MGRALAAVPTELEKGPEWWSRCHKGRRPALRGAGTPVTATTRAWSAQVPRGGLPGQQTCSAHPPRCPEAAQPSQARPPSCLLLGSTWALPRAHRRGLQEGEVRDPGPAGHAAWPSGKARETEDHSCTRPRADKHTHTRTHMTRQDTHVHTHADTNTRHTRTCVHTRHTETRMHRHRHTPAHVHTRTQTRPAQPTFSSLLRSPGTCALPGAPHTWLPRATRASGGWAPQTQRPPAGEGCPSQPPLSPHHGACPPQGASPRHTGWLCPRLQPLLPAALTLAGGAPRENRAETSIHGFRKKV